jgi:hypothetical protein
VRERIEAGDYGFEGEDPRRISAIDAHPSRALIKFD